MEAPNASSTPGDRKAGNLREPFLQAELPVPGRMCVRSSVRAESRAVQRAHSHLCSVSLGLPFLLHTCQRHSTKAVPSAPASKH